METTSPAEQDALKVSDMQTSFDVAAEAEMQIWSNKEDTDSLLL